MGGITPPFTPAATTRTWRLGFSPNPPRPTVPDVIRGIDLWSPRAEVALLHDDVPWSKLLSGMSADAIIDQDKQGLVDYLRSKNLALFFTIDLTNGLAREQEAPQLVAAGRSLAETSDTATGPHLGAGRAAPPEPGIPRTCRRDQPDPASSASVRLPGGASGGQRHQHRAGRGRGRLRAGSSVCRSKPHGGGLETSRAPSLASNRTSRISRSCRRSVCLLIPTWPGRAPPTCPLTTTAGCAVRGPCRCWCAKAVGQARRYPGFNSSAQTQASYIDRHATLLDSVSAVACVQLQFTDIELASVPAPVPANLPLFASLGLADAQFNAKPALARWDALHSRPRA
jgi:hypothetical protein